MCQPSFSRAEPHPHRCSYPTRGPGRLPTPWLKLPTKEPNGAINAVTEGSNLPHHPERLDRLVVISAVACDTSLAVGHKEMVQHLSPEMLAGTPIMSQYQSRPPAPDFPALVEKIKQLELTPPARPESTDQRSALASRPLRTPRLPPSKLMPDSLSGQPSLAVRSCPLGQQTPHPRSVPRHGRRSQPRPDWRYRACRQPVRAPQPACSAPSP